jgi:hypothetical protein
LDNDDGDSMAPDSAVADSSGGGNSGTSRRCLAPPEIGTGLSFGLDSHANLGSHAHLYRRWRRGPLPSQAWDIPDQDVESEETRTQFDQSEMEIYLTDGTSLEALAPS